jgi:hypothetical protein
LHKAGSAVLEFADNVELLSMSPAEVGVRLLLVNTGRDILRAIAAGLEEQAMGYVRQGKAVTNYGIGFSKPREVWNVPAAQIRALGEIYDLKLVKDDFAMTPKQAIKAKVPAELVRKMSITPTGTARLELNDTVRTRKIFSK